MSRTSPAVASLCGGHATGEALAKWNVSKTLARQVLARHAGGALAAAVAVCVKRFSQVTSTISFMSSSVKMGLAASAFKDSHWDRRGGNFKLAADGSVGCRLTRANIDVYFR